MMIIRPGQRLVIPGVQVFQPRVTSAAASSILDGISNVVVVYGLRKLLTAYAGSAVRVRRSSDSTEQDIGFDGAGEFDSSAFSSFVGGGTGYIKTWYDQSGNGRNATNATAGTQPKVALSAINSKATVEFSGAQFLESAISLTWTAQSTIAVASYSGSVTFQRIYSQATAGVADYSSAGHYIPILRNTTSAMCSYASNGAQASVAVAPSTPVVFVSRHTGAAITNYANGSPSSAYTHTLNTSFQIQRIGHAAGAPADPAYLTGYVAELIVLSAAISTTDHNTIGANMATRYGLSWVTVT